MAYSFFNPNPFPDFNGDELKEYLYLELGKHKFIPDMRVRFRMAPNEPEKEYSIKEKCSIEVPLYFNPDYETQVDVKYDCGYLHYVVVEIGDKIKILCYLSYFPFFYSDDKDETNEVYTLDLTTDLDTIPILKEYLFDVMGEYNDDNNIQPILSLFKINLILGDK